MAAGSLFGREPAETCEFKIIFLIKKNTILLKSQRKVSSIKEYRNHYAKKTAMLL
jgi:hypothetical protein